MSAVLARSREPLLWMFSRLLEAYGPQHWWPAETPFEVMVGAILTQNTAWSHVEKAIANLKRAGLLDPSSLAGCDPADLAGLIRPAGYFNVKTQRLQAFCRFYLEMGHERLASMPTQQLRRELLAVHGVGPETADDMLLYAFDRPVFVIDAYSRRIFSRMGLCSGTEEYDRLRLGVEQALQGGCAEYNEYHALIVRHAKEYCRKRPQCSGCPLHLRCLEPAGQ